MAVEEIKYDVLKKDGNVEIRQYAPVIIAEVTIEGSRSEAPSAAFRTLFNYISGDNIAKSGESVKIPMTAPVTQEQLEPNIWKIAFYMPANMTIETAPAPKNDKITLREVTLGKRVALRFSGRSTDDNIETHDAKLKAYLAQNNMTYDETGRILAFYNSPFTPWFLRRNEVLYPVK